MYNSTSYTPFQQPFVLYNASGKTNVDWEKIDFGSIAANNASRFYYYPFDSSASAVMSAYACGYPGPDGNPAKCIQQVGFTGQSSPVSNNRNNIKILPKFAAIPNLDSVLSFPTDTSFGHTKHS